MKQETLEEAEKEFEKLINCLNNLKINNMTAVEWLVEQLKINNYISENSHWLIDEAKEMEKEQQDEFAIRFAEWCLNSLLNGEEPKGESVEELLEIYKKEFCPF